MIAVSAFAGNEHSFASQESVDVFLGDFVSPLASPLLHFAGEFLPAFGFLTVRVGLCFGDCWGLGFDGAHALLC